MLGPLLFNDFSNISENTTCIIYADDTSLFTSAPHLNALIATGNKTLEKLRSRSQINGLKVNSTKPNIVFFAP